MIRFRRKSDIIAELIATESERKHYLEALEAICSGQTPTPLELARDAIVAGRRVGDQAWLKATMR